MGKQSSKPTIGVGIIVSGEAAFLAHSIRAIRDCVDLIAVVEGADHRWIDLGNANPDGSSLDNTGALIESLAAQPGTPIKYFKPMVYGNRNQQRQVYLEYFLEQGIDVCLVLDADEFYFPEDIQRMLSFFEENSDEVGVKYKFWNFYTWVRRYHRTIEMERCFRLEKGMKYFDQDGGQSVIDKDDNKIWPRFVRDSNITCFHYNRVLSGRDLLAKIRFYMERDGNATRETKLKAGNIGRDSMISISKSPSDGLFVPLASQPPGARSLIFSSVSQHTSWASALDIAGIFLPCSLNDLVQQAPEFAEMDFFRPEDLSAFGLAFQSPLKTSDKFLGLDFSEQLMDFEQQIFDPRNVTGRSETEGRYVIGSASYDRDHWERLDPEILQTDQLQPNSIRAIVAEHFIDKYSVGEAAQIIKQFKSALKIGGYVRLAVPDPSTPEGDYPTAGPWRGLRDFCGFLHENGLKPDPIEYHSLDKKLIAKEWSQDDGFIFRSSKGSGGKKSIIVDAFRLR